MDLKYSIFFRRSIALVISILIISSCLVESFATANAYSGDAEASMVDQSNERIDLETMLKIALQQDTINAANISVYCEKERTSIIRKIEKALKNNAPQLLSVKSGLFKGTYVLTNDANNAEYYYYGNTKDNRPNGFGVITRVEYGGEGVPSIVYAGNFKKGAYSKYGAVFETSFATNEDGKIFSFLILLYDGYWKNGSVHGKGNLFDYDDNYSAEDYFSGKLCSQIVVSQHLFKNLNNTRIYIDGNLIYKGGTNDKIHPNGKGTSYFSNGRIEYKGTWKNGCYHGKGTLFNEDGKKIYSGKWKNGDYKS